jgi:Protein of unknown function
LLKQHFHSSKRAKDMIQDAFWWYLTNDGSTNELKQSAADAALFRTAANFVSMFQSVSDRRERDQLLQYFYDALAQSLYYSLASAFPHSERKFDEGFRNELVKICADWTIGHCPERIVTSHWRDLSDSYSIALLTSISPISPRLSRLATSEDTGTPKAQLDKQSKIAAKRRRNFRSILVSRPPGPRGTIVDSNSAMGAIAEHGIDRQTSSDKASNSTVTSSASAQGLGNGTGTITPSTVATAGADAPKSAQGSSLYKRRSVPLEVQRPVKSFKNSQLMQLFLSK